MSSWDDDADDVVADDIVADDVDDTSAMPSRRGLVAPQNTFLENVVRMCCNQRAYSPALKSTDAFFELIF